MPISAHPCACQRIFGSFIPLRVILFGSKSWRGPLFLSIHCRQKTTELINCCLKCLFFASGWVGLWLLTSERTGPLRDEQQWLFFCLFVFFPPHVPWPSPCPATRLFLDYVRNSVPFSSNWCLKTCVRQTRHVPVTQRLSVKVLNSLGVLYSTERPSLSIIMAQTRAVGRVQALHFPVSLFNNARHSFCLPFVAGAFSHLVWFRCPFSFPPPVERQHYKAMTLILAPPSF